MRLKAYFQSSEAKPPRQSYLVKVVVAVGLVLAAFAVRMLLRPAFGGHTP
jgi:hypothetical protein